MLSIHLEERECFSAWMTAKDVTGFEESDTVTKSNVNACAEVIITMLTSCCPAITR